MSNCFAPPVALPTRVLVAAAVGVCALLAVPEPAWAWGPGTHLKYAEIVVNNLHLLPNTIADLIARHQGCYFYGNIIADLILGKKYNIDAQDHSHNWNNILRIKDRAPNEALDATLWGYLTHLAADVVAHNVYVPVQIVRSAPGRGRGHAYWEMHYDGHVADRYVHASTHVAAIGRPHADEFLMRELAETLFSHRTNRLIFSGTLTVQKLTLYRRFAQRSIERSPFRLERNAVHYYDRLSLNAIFDMFRSAYDGDVYRFDPNGHDAITEAARWRGGLRKNGNRPPAIDALHEHFAGEIETLPPHAFDTDTPRRRIGRGGAFEPGGDVGEQTPAY